MRTTIPGGSPALIVDSSTDRRREKEFIALINDPEFIANPLGRGRDIGCCVSYSLSSTFAGCGFAELKTRWRGDQR